MKKKHNPFVIENLFIRLCVFVPLCLLFSLTPFSVYSQEIVSLKNSQLELQWKKDTSGKWMFEKMQVSANGSNYSDISGTGNQYLIYSENAPSMTPTTSFKTNQNVNFPESEFSYSGPVWRDHISPVSLNTAGTKEQLTGMRLVSENPLIMAFDSQYGTVTTQWTVNENEIYVTQTLEAKVNGFYSLSTPQIFRAASSEIKNAVVPGYMYANTISDDFVSAYGYGHYIPNLPVVYRDKCATTPAAILTKNNNISVAVAPEKEYPRMPYDYSGLSQEIWSSGNVSLALQSAAKNNTHSLWKVGISMYDKDNEVAPALYYPVLGQQQSYMHAGQTLRFDYRYVVSDEGWYEAFKQVVYDVFDFKQSEIVRNNQSLTARVAKMLTYLTNTTTSRFMIKEYEGISIGAQAYDGGVQGANGDAMKNSDYGAMWMLASLSGNTSLKNDVLPFARNFKLKQEYPASNTEYAGAVAGQYFLWKSGRWVEEWGDFIEPIGVTYYALCDLANIILFEPTDTEAKANLRLAADYLLKEQHSDGSWKVGIRKSNKQVIYPDLKDLRGTFYGLLVAYKMLGDQKYLDAAKKGADWYITNAVNPGRFIGVCGDTRLAPDFATIQSSQMLLDMYDTTGDARYRDAAIETARMYTTYIYTYPNGQTVMHKEGTQATPVWQRSQSGLCVEHGGTIGSANTRGPIALVSFTGYFIRLYELTGDELFLNMARAGANGKDAFVNQSNGVASYYWDSFSDGPGPFPHHAWWQVGWIMDYLVAEAEMRSNGAITAFPRGFVTAKVGPHKALGFEPGKINGDEAWLVISPGLVTVNNPLCEILTAVSSNKLYVIAMNSSNEKTSTTITVNGKDPKFNKTWNKSLGTVEIDPYGIKILEIQ